MQHALHKKLYQYYNTTETMIIVSVKISKNKKLEYSSFNLYVHSRS